MTEAPRDGRYGLYSSTDRTPKVTYYLQKGDPIGFKQTDGEIVAVAGMHQLSAHFSDVSIGSTAVMSPCFLRAEMIRRTSPFHPCPRMILPADASLM